MKEALRIDHNGLIIDAELVTDDHPEFLPIPAAEDSPPTAPVEYLVTKRVPPGTFVPRWDFSNSVWVEDLTPEEIEDIRNTPVPKSPLEIRTDQLDLRTVGMQDVQDFTLLQTTTIDERTQGMQDIDEYTLETLFTLLATVEALQARIDELEAQGGA